MQLTIASNNVDLKPEDGALLVAAIDKSRQYEKADTATLYLSERRKDGWLEFMLCIEWKGGRRFTLGCIQREVGAEVEFHS